MATEILAANQTGTAERKLIVLKTRWTIFESHLRLWMIGFLILADVFSLALAIFVTLQIRRLPWVAVDPSYIELFSLLGIALVIMFGRNGLYPGVGLGYVDELRKIVSSTSFTFLVMLSFTFLLKTTHYYSRLILIITWLLALIFLPASRYLMRSLLIRWKLWGEPVVIIGHSQEALPLVEHFKEKPELGIRPVAVLRSDQCSNCSLSAHASNPLCGIKGQARDLALETALVLIEDLNEIDRLVERFRSIFHRIILVKDKNGRYGLNGLELLDFSNIMGLQVKNNLLNPWSQVLKRAMDILASWLGLLILTPVLGLIAFWIKLDSPGGVFYRQVRLGRNGQAFPMLKFRTMYQDADRLLLEKLAGNPALRKEWDSYQKLKDDPRITRVGRFLRKFSLDELPQLWNVVRAEMSLVGPRPMLPNQQALYGEAFRNYAQVAPGLTGLWQVSGRNQTTFTRRAELDNEYIQCWSVWLDIYILLKTVKVVFWQKGAY